MRNEDYSTAYGVTINIPELLFRDLEKGCSITQSQLNQIIAEYVYDFTELDQSDYTIDLRKVFNRGIWQVKILSKKHIEGLFEIVPGQELPEIRLLDIMDIYEFCNSHLNTI